MIGAVISNYKLPPSRFQFLLRHFVQPALKKNSIRKMESPFILHVHLKNKYFLNGSTFSMNSFEKEDGKEVTISFQKLSLIRFT
jgi:hypothetical protein